MPVVYALGGERIQRFSDEYRGQRGLFLVTNHDESRKPSTRWGWGRGRRRLIVCTDAEAILGIGTTGGIQIAIGQIGPLHRRRRLDPAPLPRVDVGTDNEQLLSGQPPRPRRRGREYDSSPVAISKRLNGYFRVPFCISDFGPAKNGRSNIRHSCTACSTMTCRTGAVVLTAVYGHRYPRCAIR